MKGKIAIITGATGDLKYRAGQRSETYQASAEFAAVKAGGERSIRPQAK